MNTEIQPLISGTSPTVKRGGVHRGWFVLVTVVVGLFCVAAVFHQQIGNVFGVKNADAESFTWGQLEKIDPRYISKKWEWSQECSDDTDITLTFAVKQQNVDRLDDELMKVSDPKSEFYGQHWTFAEVHEFLQPHEDSLKKIYSWLEEYGIFESMIERITPSGDFIRVKTTVQTANTMLNTRYGYWKHIESGTLHMRVQEDYYVPSSVAAHLDFISPTLRFPVESHTHSMALIGTKGDTSIKADTTYVTPSSLKSLYGVGDVKGGLSSDNVQVVASFLQEWFNDDDLEQFWNFFSLDEADVTRFPDSQPEGYGSEAELDVQYITAMGESVDTIVWDIEDDMYFISLLNQIAESDVVPSVVSMSYGGDEQSNGESYCTRANKEFAKVGLMGITFFASSGDDGAISSSDTCDDGEYSPSFPASSPYVTAVGGTTGGSSTSAKGDVETNTGEEAWYYSGGGFSVYFDAKSFQSDAVSTYFETASTLPNSARYNADGAAYPDLAAQSEAFVICYESGYYAVSGTSCSCPTVAGLFALIVDMRLTAGKSRLGWINPTLYSLYSEQSTYFNDVTEGYNLGCSVDNEVAFYASAGWDPITGMGTPKFSKLLDAFFSLGTSDNDDIESIFKY